MSASWIHGEYGTRSSRATCRAPAPARRISPPPSDGGDTRARRHPAVRPSPERRSRVPRSRPRNRRTAVRRGIVLHRGGIRGQIDAAPASTPGVAASVRSMARAHAAHVIPETGRSTRSGAAVFMPALRSRSAAPRPPGPPACTSARIVIHGRVAFSRSTEPWSRRESPPVSAPRCARNCRTSFRAPSS